MTRQRRVIMDVETRWNSSLAMLRRMVELKVPMAAVRTALYQTPDEQENLTILNEAYPRDHEWRVVSLIIDALSVFDDATLLFSSSEYGLAASMFAWMTVVLYAMEENPSGIEEVDTLRSNLQLEIGNRVKESEILIKASFFHPSFNLLYKQCDEENFYILKDILRREMQDITPPTNIPVRPAEDKPAPIHKLARAMQQVANMQNPGANAGQNNEAPGDELDRYFQCCQSLDFEINPLDWWRQHDTVFPMMAQLARKYLSIPAASVASERMFSIAGNFVTDKRNRLSDEGVSDLVFSNNALRTLQKASSIARTMK